MRYPSGFFAFACAVALAMPLAAPQAHPQEPAQTAYSMGQPSLWKPYVDALGVWAGGRSPLGERALFGIEHPLTNPVTGLLDASIEGIATHATPRTDVGARLLVGAPALGIAAGIDWNAVDGGFASAFRFETAVRRGGLLGHGTMLRVDWLPARQQRFAFGIQVPLMQPLAGRTRPRSTDADLPAPRARSTSEVRAPTASRAALDEVSRAVTIIRAYGELYSDDNEQTLSAGPPVSFEAAMHAYARGLATAFGIAAGDSARGERIAARARAGLLDDVILPFDASYGRVKEGGGNIRGLTAVARDRFDAWVGDSSGLGGAIRPAVEAVHDEWLHAIEREADRVAAQWNDSRLVWLPPQWALTPDQYAEQEQVDAFVARAVGHPFTDHNALAYLRSTDLPLEIARSIYAAREYHVLWTHDFTGRLPSAALDEVGYRLVTDAYLPALTAAVQRYDSAGTMPEYFVMLDEFYYEARDGRLWMNILENPLRVSSRLPGTDSTHEAHLANRLAALRGAVDRSSRLRREAMEHGGARWLEQVVSVHVNIVEPSDFSFRSHHIVPPLPFTADNLMRDHRKIAFYDLTEADPYRGALIMTGIGIGEQYASATWEDRGYRVRGPAAVEARAALRRALVEQGFREDQIPKSLRAAGGSPAGDERDSSLAAPRANPPTPATTRDYVGRALQVHNDAGFGVKQSSVARAMLYSLAPAGSVIIVPDPLWVSPSWAGMLAAAAARGAHVAIIAPATANSPNPEPAVMALEREVFDRLLQVRTALAGTIARAGGELRVGLYASPLPVTDVAGRLAEVRAGLARAPWISRLIPFDARTLAGLDAATAATTHDGADGAKLARNEAVHPPELHQKTLLIARPGAITALLQQPGWDRILARAMEVQSAQTARFADQLGYVTPDVDTAAVRSADATLLGYERALPTSERKAVSFYFAVGTQNHDARGMMSDGESSLIVSGFDAAAGLVDLYYLMARTTWVEAPSDVDQLVHPPAGVIRRLAHWFRAAM